MYSINLADTIGVQIVEAAPTPSTLVDNAGDWGTQDWSLRETYTVHPAVGTSIGVTGSSTVGTLGLSARIAWKETQQPDKFVALTCSHVLQRGEKIKPERKTPLPFSCALKRK